MKRRLLLGGIMGLVGLELSGRLLQGSFNGFAIPSRNSVEEQLTKRCEGKGICELVVERIKVAHAAWVEDTESHGLRVPAALDTGFLVRKAALESVLTPTNQRPGSQYQGLFQFSSESGRFWDNDIIGRLVPYLNRARANDPELEKLILKATAPKTPEPAKNVRKQTAMEANKIARQPPAPSQKPPKELEESHLRTNRELFLNTHVQVAAMLFGALNTSIQIEKAPDLRTLPLPYQQSLLYLCHNLPAVASIVQKNLNNDSPIASLCPVKYKPYFAANSGVYGKKGQATPLEILHRVAYLTQSAIERFLPGTPNQTLPSTPKRPRSSMGIVRLVQAAFGG